MSRAKGEDIPNPGGDPEGIADEIGEDDKNLWTSSASRMDPTTSKPLNSNMSFIEGRLKEKLKIGK